MINFDAFKMAHKKYKNQDMPFLAKLLKKVKQNKIYQGLKILHNTALTIEAILKIEPLVIGGADVTVSCITLLPPKEEALQIIKAANVKLQIEHAFDSDYDVHLDCCGELIYAAPPKKGTVELTQTGSEIYKLASTTYPVISVDDSKIKLLETFFGTGDGFTRALYECWGDKMYGKAYVIFGFGKVGKGIAHALKKYAIRLTVVDINIPMVYDPNFHIIFIQAAEIEKIKSALRDADCVVTATGIENVISRFYHFTQKDFGKAMLTNMGADDEYGENFSESDVLFAKKPLNFSITEPTTMKYLDPVFYAHNLGIDILLSKKMQPGYHCFPEKISAEILREWQEIHKESISIL